MDFLSSWFKEGRNFRSFSFHSFRFGSFHFFWERAMKTNWLFCSFTYNIFNLSISLPFVCLFLTSLHQHPCFTKSNDSMKNFAISFNCNVEEELDEESWFTHHYVSRDVSPCLSYSLLNPPRLRFVEDRWTFCIFFLFA